jgi:hypothetical protein
MHGDQWQDGCPTNKLIYVVILLVAYGQTTQVFLQIHWVLWKKQHLSVANGNAALTVFLAAISTSIRIVSGVNTEFLLVIASVNRRHNLEYVCSDVFGSKANNSGNI